MDTKQDTIKNAIVTICNGIEMLFGAFSEKVNEEPVEQYTPQVWLSRCDAAKLMGCCDQTVTNRADRGEILMKRFGSRLKYSRESIENFMKSLPTNN